MNSRINLSTFSRQDHDGRVAHCVLTPGTCTSHLVWYPDGVMQGVRDFDDADDARMWAHSELLLDARPARVLSQVNRDGLQLGLMSA